VQERSRIVHESYNRKVLKIQIYVPSGFNV